MNRILSIPAEQLHPGDRIVVRSGVVLNDPIDVIEPGLLPSLPGLVRVATKQRGRLSAPIFNPAERMDIDRPNLVIPGLEA